MEDIATNMCMHFPSLLLPHVPFNLLYLKLVVCILLRVLGQVQGFRLIQHWFEHLFSNRYMFRPYDHLQAEI
jgi:hypothetical protein